MADTKTLRAEFDSAWSDLPDTLRCHPGLKRYHAAALAALAATAQAQQLPDGWVPLTVEYESGYPEDVAFGPKRMMDRLKKWLDRYFVVRAIQAKVMPVEFSRPYGSCAISGPREDVEFILRHLPDVDDPKPTVQTVAMPTPRGFLVHWPAAGGHRRLIWDDSRAGLFIRDCTEERCTMKLDVPPPTGIEAEVCNDIARRQELGRNKYGTTVAENPLELIEWLQHAYEEALDQAIYLRRAMDKLRKSQLNQKGN